MNAQERFDAKHVGVTESGCWLWVSTIKHTGYGGFWMNGETIGAHRASWILHRGEIPEGGVICHKCDTPSCVNPSHLFLGTDADNVADKTVKGRAAKGSGHALAKLTEDQARQIFLARGTQSSIASRFGVHQSQVSNIKRKVTWAHATEGLIA